MRVSFRNTGMLEKADILLNGLTVIAGVSDAGKTTVGKLLYSIIRTYGKYKKNTLSQIIPGTDSLIDDYHHKFNEDFKKTPDMERMGNDFFAELKDIIKEKAEEFVKGSVSKNVVKTGIEEKVKSFSEFIARIVGSSPDVKMLPERVCDSIFKIQAEEESWLHYYSLYASSVLGSEIANKFSGSGEYSISGYDGDSLVFEVSGFDKQEKVKLGNELPLIDATFIDSPMIIQIGNAIRHWKTVPEVDVDIQTRMDKLEDQLVPDYLKNLVLKITDPPASKGSTDVLMDAGEILNGRFYYDKINRDFVFEKLGKKFKNLSIASGIHCMGIISLLEKNGFLNEKSLLIIDEPETHMYPDWQVKFAEIIVKAAGKFKILLTSHSPYLIKALRFFSEKNLEKGQSAYYWAKKGESGATSIIENVTDNISSIYDDLAAPFDKIEEYELEDF